MSNTSNPQEENTELTAEEIAAYRADMDKFYEDQLPLIRKQREYEMALADIEESRMRTAIAIIRQAQIKAGPPKEPVEPNAPTTERKLKPE